MEAKISQDVKSYFKKYVECINLEQNAETERFSLQSNGGKVATSQNGRETKLKIVKI